MDCACDCVTPYLPESHLLLRINCDSGIKGPMKLADLITLVSDVTGEDHGVVRVKARALREAGLLKQGGRGRGGAEMEARDVARLILSILSSQSTTADRQLATMEATVPTYAKWSWHSGNVRGAGFAYAPPPPLRSLPTEHNITDALEALFRQSVTIEHLSVEQTEDGETVSLGFRGIAEDPDEGGECEVDWWVDYAVPYATPRTSHLRSVLSLDGHLITQIADRANVRGQQ